jgi:hypothetical protein
MPILEPEFITCLEASREVKWVPQLQKDIPGSEKDSLLLPINCNPPGALTVISPEIINTQTKHIDVCYHNSQDLHRQQIINYSYINTNQNVAAILPKALTQGNHTKFTKVMGLW